MQRLATTLLTLDARTGGHRSRPNEDRLCALTGLAGWRDLERARGRARLVPGVLP
jgi:hypothetical protein